MRVCLCVCERDEKEGGKKREKRKTDMAGMMEDGRSEHQLILGI